MEQVVQITVDATSLKLFKGRIDRVLNNLDNTRNM